MTQLTTRTSDEDLPPTRGMVILFVCFALIVLLDIAAIASTPANDDRAVSHAVRMALTVLLLRCVWVGKPWAAALLLVLLVPAGILGLLFGLLGLLDGKVTSLLFLAIVYLATALALLLPPVKAFLGHQRAVRG